MDNINDQSSSLANSFVLWQIFSMIVLSSLLPINHNLLLKMLCLYCLHELDFMLFNKILSPRLSFASIRNDNDRWTIIFSSPIKYWDGVYIDISIRIENSEKIQIYDIKTREITNFIRLSNVCPF